MANFVITIDSAVERRSHFISKIQPIVAPVDGLIHDTCIAGNFCAIWAAAEAAPVCHIADDDGASVRQSSDEGYTIPGSTESFGAGEVDVYLVKTDRSGNLEWQRAFGGARVDHGYAVEQTRNGGYVVAGSTHSLGTGLGPRQAGGQGQGGQKDPRLHGADLLIEPYGEESVLE
jgi:hypothetical protein